MVVVRLEALDRWLCRRCQLAGSRRGDHIQVDATSVQLLGECSHVWEPVPGRRGVFLWVAGRCRTWRV